MHYAFAMRIRLAFFLALAFVASACVAGDFRFALQYDGLERAYRVHVPARYDASHPAPLLVAMHGGGGNMDIQADDRFYGEITTSEKEGAIVVFPNGTSRFASGKLATWNAGDCCAGAVRRGADDVGFIRAVVADVEKRWMIDKHRVYATGMSNGGMMAYRLACEAADVFTAIASVAGTDNTRECKPSKPVAVLHIQAKDDPRVLYDGGQGKGATSHVSAPSTIAKWVQLDKCEGASQRVLDKPGAWCELHSPCSGGAQVKLCVTETGGHSWPGGAKPRGGPAPSNAISANDMMWDFFNRLQP
jgi:polyhydroxybutyrate depolymerase